MTVTTPTSIDSSIPEIWAKQVLRDSLRMGFWANKVGGEGSRMPIIRKTELLNNAGDSIHVEITNPLAGGGQSGDTSALTGNEEEITTTEKKIIPVLYRHAVRLNRRARKKSIIDLLEEAKMRLTEWGGEKMDDLRFAAYNSAAALHSETYTPYVRVVGGGTGVGDVATTDTLDVATIMQAKLDLYNNRALPLKDGGGRDFFMAVVHPNTLYNLKRSTEYGNWVRDAGVRGENNPLFIGATAMIDGVLIFEHNNVPVTLDGASSNAVSHNIVFGAEAFIEGADEDPHFSGDTFDYGLETGVGYEFAFESRRALEKNSTQLLAAATAP